MKKGLFDEYRQHSDPEVRQRAINWGIAIGLQDVDGLCVSPYLIELAKRNIEGEITIDEVRELIAEYYRKKHESEPPQESAEYTGYIIEPSAPRTGQHQMSINGKRDDFNTGDFIAVARHFDIYKPQEIINTVCEAAQAFGDFAKIAGVPGDIVNQMLPEFRTYLKK